jgi:uncharacterized protein
MNPPAPPSRQPLSLVWRALRFVCLVAAGFIALLVGCQSRLLYFPRPYQEKEPTAFQKRGGLRLDFSTGEGRQAAWLIPPRNGQPLDRLWIVCGGNAARALDMEDFCRSLPFPADAWLLVDYPGYGDCEGSTHPDCIRESLRTAVPLAAEKLELSAADVSARTCVFGHSLGCAAVLIAAGEFNLRRAVLCSPFTSTMDMATVVLKVPLGFLVRHRFDNREGLAALAKNNGRAWIFHGAGDDIVPCEMSHTLAREFPSVVTCTEVPAAGHNDILACCRAGLINAMTEARRN